MALKEVQNFHKSKNHIDQVDNSGPMTHSGPKMMSRLVSEQVTVDVSSQKLVGVDHMPACYFHGFFKSIQAIQLCIRTKFNQRISFCITIWISKTLWMVGICDISLLCNSVSYSDYNTSMEEELLELPGLLLNFQRQLKIKINKIFSTNCMNYLNVQPQAKSNGNTLVDHQLHRDMSILDIKHRQLCYLFNN